LPASLVLFLLVPGDPESGAAYVLDRKSGTWYAVDFEDLQYGGYSVTQLETLLKDCSSLISWNGRGFGALDCHGGGTLGRARSARSGRLTEKIFRVIYQHPLMKSVGVKSEK